MKKHNNKYTKKLRDRSHKKIVKNAVMEVRKSVLQSPIIQINVKKMCISIAKKHSLRSITVIKGHYRTFKSEKSSILTKKIHLSI